jgi:nitrate reductase beta subunit
VNQVEEMYRVMAIANYEDRFVIPPRTASTPRTPSTCAAAAASASATAAAKGTSETSLFGSEKKRTIPIKAEV